MLQLPQIIVGAERQLDGRLPNLRLIRDVPTSSSDEQAIVFMDRLQSALSQKWCPKQADIRTAPVWPDDRELRFSADTPDRP